MTTKHEETSGKRNAPKRGGGLGPTKDADKQHRTRSTEEALDEALEESFPASDPPSQSQPAVHVGGKKKHEKKPD